MPLPKANKNGTLLFELKLVVIGTLLAVYWQMVPSIVQPAYILVLSLTFNLVKGISIALGVFWFLILLMGVDCLISKLEKRKVDRFDRYFSFSSKIMIGFVAFVLTAYVTLSIMAIKDIMWGV